MRASGLDHALSTLGPYLSDLVVCGGWAWYLYRRCLGSGRWLPAEFTRDLDCLGPERLPVRDVSLAARLEAGGFLWTPRGTETPPAAAFTWVDTNQSEVEIEFLVPARGGHGTGIVEIQRPVTAQALRHVEILLDDPLRIIVDDASPLARELAFRGIVRIPRAGHFSVQKALMHRTRGRAKQIKDFFYVFDLVDSTNGLSDTVLDDLVRADARWRSQIALFRRTLGERAQEPSFLLGIAEQYPSERRPSVAYVGRELRLWLERLAEARHTGEQHR